MSLTKLHFEVFGKDKYDFQVDFNPTEYTLARQNAIACRKRNRDKAVEQYVGVSSEDLTFNLLFDTTRHGIGYHVVDVTTRTSLVERLMKVDGEKHAVPRFWLTWGKGLKLFAVAIRMRQRFTLFNPAGIPLRSEVELTIREVGSTATGHKETKRSSPDRTKAWVVHRGETMTTIAAHAYDDPRHWRVIADHNPRVDPRRPAPGTVLELPPLPAAEGPTW